MYFVQVHQKSQMSPSRPRITVVGNRPEAWHGYNFVAAFVFHAIFSAREMVQGEAPHSGFSG